MRLGSLNPLSTNLTRRCFILLLVVLVCLLFACAPPLSDQADRLEEEPLVIVTPEEVTPEPTPTEATCTPLPEGMTLQIETNAYGTVYVEVEGLLPGEEPLLLLTLERENQTMSLKARDFAPIGQDRRFEWINDFGMEMMQGCRDDPWQGEVKIVHSRGVACEEFTLP